jgi:TatD DNase family protein
MLYDTHCHLNLPDYEENERTAIIEDCLAQCVWMNNVGTDYESSVEAVRLANLYEEGVYAVVGSHPENFLPNKKLDDVQEFDFEKFKKLASHPKVLGIGECGLDYYRLPEINGEKISREQAFAAQSPAFLAQLRLAKELDKALVIHCRPSAGSEDAYEDILEILKNERPEKFEMHSFTGSWKICEKFLDLGGYIAINGIITFDKTGALAEIIKNIPIERLLLETDAPFLAPAPFRGKRNQPQYIKYTAEFAENIRTINVGENIGETTGLGEAQPKAEISTLADQTYGNSLTLFHLTYPGQTKQF